MKPTVYLSQHHGKDRSLTLKEDCGKHWNIGWICRAHGAISFKRNGARNTTRYLLGELAVQGVDGSKHPKWCGAEAGQYTHCSAGSGYEGHIILGSVENAVKYLKRFFTVVACKGNTTETQKWIDGLDD